MRHSVHTSSCSQALWQRVHQFGIHDSNTWDIVGVNANHLGLTRLVDDDIVDGGLSSRTSCCGQGDDGQGFLLGVGNALKRNDVAELRVVHYNTNAFGCVHAGTATNSHDKVSTCFLASFYAILHVRYSRVWLYVIENFIFDASLVHNIKHHLGYSKLHQALVGYN